MSDHRVEFTLSENPWAPTAVVAEINDRTDSGLDLVGLAEQTGGTSSAAYVRWPDGRHGALTRTSTPLDRMRQTADVLSMARSRGLPVPRHDLVIALADGHVAVVQERLPGRHAGRVDASVIDAMVAMNEQFAGLLVDRSDVPSPPTFPTPGPGHHPWEQTLGRYSDRSRRLLRRFREMGGGDLHEMTGDDLVHTDYTFDNVLFDESGRISGIVDWNFGAARGDRRFALLSLRINLAGYRLDPDGGEHGVQPVTVDRLDEILDTTIDPARLRIWWAHKAVHSVHWSIRHNFRPERINSDLRFAESHLT